MPIIGAPILGIEPVPGRHAYPVIAAYICQHLIEPLTDHTMGVQLHYELAPCQGHTRIECTPHPAWCREMDIMYLGMRLEIVCPILIRPIAFQHRNNFCVYLGLLDNIPDRLAQEAFITGRNNHTYINHLESVSQKEHLKLNPYYCLLQS